MAMTALVPFAVVAAIALWAVRSYQKHLKVEARVCRDVRQVLARIAPLADAGAMESAEAAAAQTEGQG
jgi:hypothetical protein